jgi:selenide, water dikinase
MGFLIMKKIVLIGGGHSHAIVLKNFSKEKLDNINLSLISDSIYTPYSGMLPGHLAGFYSYEETHIDLAKLANSASAQFYQDRVIGLDLTNNLVFCDQLEPIEFDYLSIDIGSIPNTANIPGAKEQTIPIKPVANFLNYWYNFLEQVKLNQDQPICLAIVGGGAGGVEVALNIHSRFKQLGKESLLEIHLFQKNKQLLANHNQWVSQRLEQILREKKIKLHLSETVTEIKDNQIICQSGLKIQADPIFWVTQASAQPWIKTSGITTDSKGFILVQDTLQSISHPHIFAAGDIATMVNYDRPKAGVFAVRQGKPLWENLQRVVLGKPLKNYHPQERYLALIGTGDREAIASWGKWGFQSSWLWLWKDYLDRRFMAQFSYD